MMDRAKFETLIDKLIAGTERGVLEWKETDFTEKFAVQVGKATIELESDSDSAADDFYSIVVKNEKLRSVDSDEVYESEDSPLYTKLNRLWLMARQRVLRIDETIEGILENLDQRLAAKGR